MTTTITPNSDGFDVSIKTARINLKLNLNKAAAGALQVRSDTGEIIGSGTLEVLPAPAVVPDDRERLAQARTAICKTCSNNQGLTRYTVACAGCGCAGLSLLNGSCKLGKWPTEPPAE